jgi:outer membrane lipoprotein carrier protein
MSAALAALLAASPLVAQDPAPILERASTAYHQLTTLTADFVQVVTNPMLGTPDTARGRLYLQRPSRFAMEFVVPRGDRVVADGIALWLYTPSTTPGQVLKVPIPAEGTTGPNLIGQFVERPLERYDATYFKEETLSGTPCDAVTLIPKAADAQFRRAVIWIDRERGLVRRILITETSGQMREVRLSGLTVNPTVPARRFRFSPPAGTRVVEQGR